MKTGEKNKISYGDAEARSVAGTPPASLPSRLPVKSDLEGKQISSSESGDLVQPPHIVAFLDILGASSEMKKSDREFLKKINKVYGAVCDFYKSWCGESEKSAKIRIFSDNILIAKKISGELSSAYLAFVDVQALARMVQAYGLTQGLFFRGGISRGSFYINDTFVYGAALVDAYEQESSCAIYPRIVVAPNVFSGMNSTEFFTGWGIPKDIVLQRDTDGMAYLNVFGFVYRHFGSQALEAFSRIRKNLQAALNKTQDRDPKAHAKCCWLASAFNKFCEENSEVSEFMLQGI